jgi:hypothetical protein
MLGKKPEEENLEEQGNEEYIQSSEPPSGKDNFPKMKKDPVELLLSELEKDPENKQSKAIFVSGILIVIAMMFVRLMEYFNYPGWMEFLHPIIIFTEALIPFSLSFFLSNPRQSTILRVAGIIVLFTYLFALF